MSVWVNLIHSSSYRPVRSVSLTQPGSWAEINGSPSRLALREREHCAPWVCQRRQGAAAGANRPQVCGLKDVHALPPPYASPGWLGALPVSSGTERGWSRQQREHGPRGTHSCRAVLWPPRDSLSCSQLIGRNRPHGPRNLRAREWNVTTCQEGRGWEWVRTSTIMSGAHPFVTECLSH